MTSIIFRNALIATVFALFILTTGEQAAARDSYGAIAYSQSSGAIGYSYNQPTRAAAERQAYDICYRNSGGRRDCRVVQWFRNSCGAVAVGSSGGYGAGNGSNRANAEYDAIRVCSQYDRNCRIIQWVCTGR